jgi:hypothetical protein
MKLVFALMTMMTLLAAPVLGAVYHSTNEVQQQYRMVNMSCCQCYADMPDGKRFYLGIREVESCRSYRGGHCTEFVPCFK